MTEEQQQPMQINYNGVGYSISLVISPEGGLEISASAPDRDDIIRLLDTLIHRYKRLAKTRKGKKERKDYVG